LSSYKIWQPLLFALVLAGGIYIGIQLGSTPGTNNIFSVRSSPFNKFNDIINFVSSEYVDTINAKMLVDKTIEDMLHSLDPHSSYIPAEDLQAVNEPLQGNFEGIGVEFHIQQDTIMVVHSVPGGPSEQLGIKAGDRIIKIDGKNVAGTGITNQTVLQTLRGEGGTKVKVSISRRGLNKLIDYTITRGKIPIHSVDVAYMLSDKIGYVKISQFAGPTHDEYLDAFMKLKKEGMQQLIVDLRGNGGGYLKTAIQLADEFLDKGKLVVYTKGRAKPKESYEASPSGFFETGDLVVLIDEGSASASEILAGALQDWDRAVIVGRRSFGKGLVQEQTQFADGSAMRLTVARYYTPTGRSIQKPYSEGYDAYQTELIKRLKSGELQNADSIKVVDSLQFKTPGGKTVFGGGGITPDVFVAIDTSDITEWYTNISSEGILTQFVYDYVDANRATLKKYKNLNDFKTNFEVGSAVFNQLVTKTSKAKIKNDPAQIELSKQLVTTQIKALIARQLFRNEGYYTIIQSIDNTLLEAVKILNQPKSTANQ
jgi:carboxyl-terminal processing protease